ncbi:trimethylamine methyltransferase family protein [Paracoccaceae bacterium Fryx2]|nr:trimethylamine methyltransferase family protein [Paracoccaceae bacterium Fryx2]
MVVGQLARRLNLPLRCSGNVTTSKLPDAQAMTEGTLSMLAAILGGDSFILYSVGFLDGLPGMSREKFKLDADLCGAPHGCPNGVLIDDSTLAADAFAAAGPGNRFFGCAHTIRNHETAFRNSEGGGQPRCGFPRQCAVEEAAGSVRGPGDGRNRPRSSPSARPGH